MLRMVLCAAARFPSSRLARESRSRSVRPIESDARDLCLAESDAHGLGSQMPVSSACLL